MMGGFCVIEVYLINTPGEFVYENGSIQSYRNNDATAILDHLSRFNFSSLIQPNFILESGSLVLLWVSMQVFHNPRVLPLISSIFLLLLSYLISLELTKNRIISLISPLILLFTNSFTFYAESFAYPAFWTTLFMFSFYLSIKSNRLAIIPYVLSIPMKAITITFLPILIICNKSKIQRIILLSLIPISIFLLFYFQFTIVFQESKISNAILQTISGFRHDIWIELSLPLIFYLLYRIHDHSSKILTFSMIWILTQSFLLVLLTNYSNQPYRLLPFFTLYAITISYIITKLTIQK